MQEPSTDATSSTRRSYLRALGAVVAGSAAGCAGFPATGEGRQRIAKTCTSDVEDSPGPVRCRGDPVSVDRTFSGADDDVWTSPPNRTVQFDPSEGIDAQARNASQPFFGWGVTHTTRAGEERVREATAERLEIEEFRVTGREPPPFASTDASVVSVEVRTLWDRDCDVLETPGASLWTLADAAPRSVDATASLEGYSFSRTVPVFANHTYMQYV